jgi:hypothetical protein
MHLFIHTRSEECDLCVISHILTPVTAWSALAGSCECASSAR